MNQHRLRRSYFSLSGLFLLLGICPIHAARSYGPPSWSDYKLETVGGVTYFTHTSTTFPDSCSGIFSKPVNINGTNITQEIYTYFDSGGGIACLEELHKDTNVSVLGALPPGDYSFTVLSIDDYYSTNVVPYLVFYFNVPAATNRTLTAVSQINQTMQISVAGITNVNYVLQRSTALTNWTSLKTNEGPVVLWNEPMSDTNTFYRTLILGKDPTPPSVFP